jgi:dCTP deaminase
MSIAKILADRQIRAQLEAGVIRVDTPLDDDQIQPASMDLRLGNKAYRLRASFLPGRGVSVTSRLCAPLVMHEIDLCPGAVLETGCIYLVPLMETLNLPADISARTNPKSSTGRIDVFTRVITDGAFAFDTLAPGYSGKMWLEISPRTFSILVRPGDRLSQIRLRRETEEKNEGSHDAHRALDVSLALAPDTLVGFRAKRHAGVLDLRKLGGHDPRDFWEALTPRGGQLILDPGEFYILASKEAICIPPDEAAEMAPIAPEIGEFRVHYAGFFDPGFGYDGAGGTGAKAVLEVRGRDVPFILEDGQTVAKLVFEAMSETPAALYGATGSNYQGQGLKLSKLFGVWE